jgi:hypothetical protein
MDYLEEKLENSTIEERKASAQKGKSFVKGAGLMRKTVCE